MEEIEGRKFLSTSEMIEKTGRPRSTLVRWANRGVPGAHWNNYIHAWEWDLEAYVAGKMSRTPKPQAVSNGRRAR